MSIVIRDEDTAASFSSVSSPEEVRTSDGRLLGRFIPNHSPVMSFPEVGLTDAELERRLNDPKAQRHTPEQVMTRIRELDQCSR